MKIIVFLLAFLLFSSFAPDQAVAFKLTFSLILAFIVGLWELVIRLIPTAGQYGVIGKIIEVLSWLSNFLNRKSK
jgi:hypothetical protein